MFITLILVLSILSGLVLLGQSAASVVRIRSMKRQIRNRRLRAHFAEQRLALLKAADRGDLSPASTTFRVLYVTHTHVMRRSDGYEELARSLAPSRQTPRSPVTEAYKAEQEDWTEEVADIARETADGLWQLVLEHNAFWRAAEFVERRTGALSKSMSLLVQLLRGLTRILREAAEKQEEEHLEDIRPAVHFLRGRTAAA
ncbi:MAG: hypothetical protein VX899_06785 [Myxococcota bacterium]|nr:hypothetical protein [Myxococcota bacterium]